MTEPVSCMSNNNVFVCHFSQTYRLDPTEILWVRVDALAEKASVATLYFHL